MTKLIRPTNGEADPRFLERDELEMELVRRDKQALIGDCLKIFDTNTMIFEQIETMKARNADLEKQVLEFKAEVDRLERRSMWAVINERLEWRIEKIRKRRTETNYPTP